MPHGRVTWPCQPFQKIDSYQSLTRPCHLAVSFARDIWHAVSFGRAKPVLPVPNQFSDFLTFFHQTNFVLVSYKPILTQYLTSLSYKTISLISHSPRNGLEIIKRLTLIYNKCRLHFVTRLLLFNKLSLGNPVKVKSKPNSVNHFQQSPT